MAIRLACALALCLGAMWISTVGAAAQPPPRADASEMAAFFHDDLAPYGRWIDHRIYGVVWVPASGQPDWHPYTDGRWVWTTDYGWYWDLREPYGWATYHYGSWALTSDYGWVWVPGNEWAPAWVEWRYGDDHVGWAPMPPERRTRGSDAAVQADAKAWVFVPSNAFALADVGQHRVEAGPLLASTSVVTNYASEQGRIVNRSIDVGRIAAAAKTRIDPVRTVSVTSLSDKAGKSGDVVIYRPLALATPKLAAPSGLNLDLPTSAPDFELDPDAAAKARAKLGPAPLPEERGVHGSVETSVGGTIGSDTSSRAPSGGSSGLGVGLPGLGSGVRIGR